MARPRSYPYGATIRSKHLTFSAGVSCLDFANTRELRRGPNPQEYLHDYEDVLVFARRVALLPSQEIGRLRGVASDRSRAAGAAFEFAVELRESIYAVASALARGSAPQSRDLHVIDAARRHAAQASKITFRTGRFVRTWTPGPEELDLVLWPIAESAAALLLDDVRAPLVRECHGVDCGWLFLDQSRSKRRRWCDMSACGNRAKAARHYAKGR